MNQRSLPFGPFESLLVNPLGKSSLPRPGRGPGNFKCEKRVFPGRYTGSLLVVRIWFWGKGLPEEGRLEAGFSRILYLTLDS